MSCSIGCGRCGDVEIELHESDDESTGWDAQIRIGQFSFNCDVESPDIMRNLSVFFDETFRTGKFLDEEIEPGVYRYMETKELELGRNTGVPVFIRKDGEFDDRYFMRVGLAGGYIVYTPTIEQVEYLIEAVKQVVGDLND